MSKQIQIKYAEVDQALKALKASIQSLQPDFPSDIGGNNFLDVVATLTILNQKTESLLNSYKEILMQNEVATEKSVETMKETDERLATSIQSGKYPTFS